MGKTTKGDYYGELSTKFKFFHLADAFIQSDLQLRNTISKTL